MTDPTLTAVVLTALLGVGCRPDQPAQQPAVPPTNPGPVVQNGEPAPTVAREAPQTSKVETAPRASLGWAGFAQTASMISWPATNSAKPRPSMVEAPGEPASGLARREPPNDAQVER